jgi:hypothetical protein
VSRERCSGTPSIVRPEAIDACLPIRRTISPSQLQFHYVDECAKGRNAFRRIRLNSVIITRTGKLTTCSPCSLIPRTLDNEPIREVRCPLCTVANCPARRGYDYNASIGPTSQRGMRSKPGYNRFSGRLWSLCSRYSDHDLCPYQPLEEYACTGLSADVMAITEGSIAFASKCGFPAAVLLR